MIFFIVLWWWDNNVSSNTKFDNNNLDNDILQIPPLCQELCTGNVTDINFQVATCRCICNNIPMCLWQHADRFVATCWWQSWAKLGNICKMIIIHSFCVNYLGKGLFRCQEQSQPIFRGSFFVYLFISPKLRFPNIQFTLDLKIYSMEWLGKQFLDWQAPLKWHWVNREWWDVKQSYVSIIKWLNNHIYQLSSD